MSWLRFCSPRPCRGATHASPLPSVARALLPLLAVLTASLRHELRAAAPAINQLSPIGLRRGETTKLVVTGSNLTPQTQIVAPFALGQATLPAEKPDPSRWEAKLLVHPRTPPGVYPVRVRTEEGLSNPQLLVVGDLPELAEAEENNTPAAAQPITLPLVVTGQAQGGDLDYFRFQGKAGQRIVAEVAAARIGSGVDPAVHVFGPISADAKAEGPLLASDDDTPALSIDCRVSSVLPTDGLYLVKVHDSRFAGVGNPFYRLKIGELSWAEEVFPLGGQRGKDLQLQLRGGSLQHQRTAGVSMQGEATADRQRLPLDELGITAVPSPWLAVGDYPEYVEVEPIGESFAAGGPSNSAISALRLLPAVPDTPQQTDVINWPATINGRMDAPGDLDRFEVAVQTGQRLRVSVQADESGSLLDGFLSVENSHGAQLSAADDLSRPALEPGLGGQVSRDPSLELTVPQGAERIRISLRDLHDRGGTGYTYRLTIEAAEPTFDLRMGAHTVNVPRGGTASIGLSVLRRGYGGPIQLGVAGLPADWRVWGGHIPEGQNQGTLTITAPQGTLTELFELIVYGEGWGGERAFRRTADATVVYARDSTVAVAIWRFPRLAAAVALPRPLALQPQGGDGLVELVHGYSVAVPIKVARQQGFSAAVSLAAANLPNGVTVAAANVAEGAVEGSLAFSAVLQAGEPRKESFVTNGEVRDVQIAVPGAPLGKLSVVVEGAAGDVKVVAPSVTLELVRPFAVEVIPLLAPPSKGGEPVELKAGGSAKVRGRVVRRGPFKETVDVRLEGLPPKVTAQAVTVAADRTEFEIELTAAGDAAAGNVDGVRLLASSRIQEKAYTLPPLAVGMKVLAAP